ncbi:hypothetical protein TD95_004080 [Thielaviopsis punctulata]|uniref:Signal recognition particle SRP19 subunit n=1 Tax=Thielaviopsis punctulata TaxID=72032 RepID=A0A0F4ZL87_9PEZI|nr:hypothetical protein TD95_004080 [Thielaviopsis punctulata]
MSHARVEEVSDSDSDPSVGNISDFEDTDIIRRVEPVSRPAPAANTTAAAQSTSPFAAAAANRPRQVTDTESFKDGHVLYPIYFDAARSRADGRRVSKDLAVANPLARTIAEACSALKLQPLLEPSKTHPKDWANPGRVRVKYPPPEMRRGAPNVLNKHHLYRLVAEFLAEFPTTDKCEELRVRIPGLPLPMPKNDEEWPRPAVPRGWKMGSLLPLLSPALTGGGVSENLFKDMMKEMQNGKDPMAALMGAAQGGMMGMGGSGGPAATETDAGKKKKDKKGKGKA